MNSEPEIATDDPGARLPDAFEAALARHGPMVFRVALRVLHDHHEAEDVVQSTFIELARHPEVFSQHLAAWLHRAAVNAATDVLRSRARRARREETSRRPEATHRGDDPGELREEIDAALDRLPVEMREAVVLHHLEGRDYPESARLAGCSEDALRKRSQRGLRRLRDHLLGRGVVCSLGSLAAFLGAESTAGAALQADLAERLSRLGDPPPPALRAAPRAAARGVLGANAKFIAAAVLAAGSLAYLGAQTLARRGAAPAESAPARGWSAAARARFRPLPLGEAATASSARPMFSGRNGGRDVLLMPYWGEVTVRGVPFQVVDPRGGSVRNVVALRSPRGDYSRGLPGSATVVCGVTARAIHLLGGVSGWGYPVDKGRSVSMVVLLKYAGGSEEAHYLLNGAQFAHYAGGADVPGSEAVLRLGLGNQVRYLVVTPSRSEPVERIEFRTGDDATAPVVVAVTVETGSP